MPLKHVLTQGLGFPDGTKYVITQGLSTGVVVFVSQWPSSLPDPELPGYQETEAVGFLRSSIPTGLPMMRRRTAAGPQPFSCTLMLTRAQVATFDAFYVGALFEGVKAFEWEHPRTKAVATLRIASDPEYQGVAYNVWRVSCQMEVLA